MSWKTLFLRNTAGRPAWFGYVLALGLTALALICRLALPQAFGMVQPFAFFYVSVAISAWRIGLGAGVFAALAGLFAGLFFVMEPRFSLAGVEPMAVVTYAITCSCFILMMRAVRRSAAALERSEERFALISQATNDAVWDWDLRTDRLWWNEGLESLFGHPVGDESSSSAWWAEHIHPDDRKRVVSAVRSVIDGGGGEWRDEYRYRRADGSHVHVFGRGFVVRDVSGAALRMLGGMKDISARKRAEAALRQSEERFRNVFERAAVGMGRVDLSDGCWIDANDALCRMVGYSRDEMRATPWPRITHPDDLQLDLVPFRQLATGEIDSYAVEKRFLHKEGHEVFARLTLSLVRDAEGRPEYEIAIVEDVTERKRARMRLQESESRFRVLFEHAPLGTYLIHPETLQIVDCNDRAAAELGYTREELCQLRVPDIDAGFSEAEISGLGRRIVQQGENLVIDTTHRTKSGDLRSVLITAAPIRVGGKVLNYAAVLDITARKRSEAALRENEARFRALADNIPQLAWMTDPSGWITWFNKRWYEYTGATLEQMQGWGWQAVHHPDHSGRVTEKWRRCLAARERWEDTFPLRGQDGEYRWFLSRAVPIQDSAGTLIGWFGTNTDITAQRDTEQALGAAKAELERHAHALEKIVAERTARLSETVAELESFSYSLSHDMRAPLRAMMGFADVLAEDFSSQLGPVGAGYLQRIAAAAGRLDQLIRDVLTYSKVVRDRIELRPVAVETLVRQLVEENPALQPPLARIEVVSPLLPVLGHEASLTQVLSNLLYNAVKFVRRGNQPQIRIWTAGHGHRVRLHVRDNGIGIPAEAQAKIFGMFQRLHSAQEYEGTGIGLAIVRKAVERMGGQLGLESTPGEGSTFWVELEGADDNARRPRLHHIGFDG